MTGLRVVSRFAAGSGAQRLVILGVLAAAAALCADAWQARSSALRAATARGEVLLQLAQARIGAAVLEARRGADYALDRGFASGAASAAAARSGIVPTAGQVRAVLLLNRFGALVAQYGPDAGGDRPTLPEAWINPLRRPARGPDMEVLGVIGAGSPGARVAMGLRAPAADGQFAGAAVVLLDPAAVSASLEVARPGPGGVVSIQSDTGEVLFRLAPSGRASGGRPNGPQAAPADDAHADRLVLARADAGLGMTATVELDERDIFADWKARLRWQGALMLLVLALAALALAACRAAQRQQRQAQLLADALDAGDDAACIAWDGAGRLLLASRRAAPLLGLAPGKLAAGTGREALAGLLAASRVKHPGHGEAARDGLAGSFLIGGSRRVLLTETPFDGGRILTRIADTTAACLLQEQGTASARIEAMAQLAAKMGHDFNNVLTVTQGHLDLLQRTLPEGSRHATLAASAMAGARRGAELVVRLMGFGITQPGDYKPASLAGLLDEVAALAQPSLGETVALDMANAAPDVAVLCDGSELKDAVLNLLANARDAMPDGGWISLRVGVEEVGAARTTRNGMRLDPGRYARIDVSDHGAGIPEDACTRVFEPFFTTKKKARGAGLGLSMVYGFCRRHRGVVEAAAQPGGGTVLSMFLPALQGGATVTQAPEAGT